MVRGIIVGELRIIGGEIRIPTEGEQDDLALGDLSITGSRKAPDAPLTFWGELYLNGLPSEDFLTISDLQNLGSEDASTFEAGLESDFIHAFANGDLTWSESPRANIDAQINTDALGELSRWLRLPVDDGSP